METQIVEEKGIFDFVFNRGKKKKEVPRETPPMHGPVGFLQKSSMYIMAALSEGDKHYEVELASLYALENGGLEVRPKICKGFFWADFQFEERKILEKCGVKA